MRSALYCGYQFLYIGVNVDICRCGIVCMAQNLLQNLRSYSIFSSPTGIGMPGSMWSLSAYPEFFQQRVVIPLRKILRNVLTNIARQQQVSICMGSKIQSRKRYRSQFHPDRPAGTSISRLCLAWAVDPWRNIDTKWIPTISSGSQVPLETSVSIRKNPLSRLLHW